VLDDEGREQLDEEATKAVEDAVGFAEDADFPSEDSLYDHVYVDP
jgi:TPP-dependent pyruvate/acetoin dehydrogenase alpha subunit